jgi:hypothetical protein
LGCNSIATRKKVIRLIIFTNDVIEAQQKITAVIVAEKD